MVIEEAASVEWGHVAIFGKGWVQVSVR